MSQTKPSPTRRGGRVGSVEGQEPVGTLVAEGDFPDRLSRLDEGARGKATGRRQFEPGTAKPMWPAPEGDPVSGGRPEAGDGLPSGHGIPNAALDLSLSLKRSPPSKATANRARARAALSRPNRPGKREAGPVSTETADDHRRHYSP